MRGLRNGISDDRREGRLVELRDWGFCWPKPKTTLLSSFTGTAAEVSHLRSVDRIMIGDGSMGPITTALHDAFFNIVNGLSEDRYYWLTPVTVRETATV